MSLLPVSTSRTSTPLSNQRLLFQLNNDQLQLQRQYDQLSTGQRVLRLSDDPAAAGRAITLHRGIDRSEQLIRNTTSTANFYQGADSALERVDNALIQARASAVEGAQGIISDDERAAIATSIQESINSVFAAGNSVFRDHQLLGGFLDTDAAFAFDGKDILFQGTDAVARTKVGAGIPTAINVNASESIGAFATFLEGDPLNAALDENSRLVDLRRGQGVTAGVIKISGGGNFVDIDLTNAATIGDVASLISEVELDGRPIAASLTSDGIRIEYEDGLAGTMAITDSVGSTTARELAIANPTGLIAPPIIGDGLSPRVTLGTKLTDLNDGAGLSLGSGIRIDQGDKSFTVNFDDAETLGDVIIAINRSDADVKAELNEAEGRIVLRSLRSGVDYSIGENGGNDARSLGIRSATEETLLADLNRGRGLRLNFDGPDLTIARPDGVELDLELEGVESIQDVIELIRNHPQNQDSRRVLVDLNDVGNGLQLKAPPGADPLTIRQNGPSDAGIQLGLIPPGQSEVSGGVVGSVDTIIGQDYVPRDAGGALDTLLRLQRAVLAGDVPEIGRLQAKLDTDLDQSSRTRGRVGVWARNLDALQETAESDVIAMRSQLSNEIDADLTTVISDLNQRQVALEASLRVIGQTSQLTVLNYL
ncbi:Flagellar hook-associated protein 3 [Rubripirellula obstinata]|uniref:Flagellar hook-associated protein 3 n=1 Tax=Rubripirellula obstinata TaxID=406547 RepID=A0A5B1CPP6_9BACT|nr:flagellin hook IN motif-containing protein [Rubripirellula obstinata]KAA1262342.1 Flagellar hook-associated protein 3 [Rubripirellula obstinata]